MCIWRGSWARGTGLRLLQKDLLAFATVASAPHPFPDPAGIYPPSSVRGGHSMTLPSGSFIRQDPVPGPLGAMRTCGSGAVLVVVVAVVVVVVVSSAGTSLPDTNEINHITSTAVATKATYATKFLEFSLIFFSFFGVRSFKLSFYKISKNIK